MTTGARTKAGRRLALWLAEADIRWPDDSTRIGGAVLTDAILAIEAEAAAGPRDRHPLNPQSRDWWGDSTEAAAGPRDEGLTPAERHAINAVLDRPYADPDDDAAIAARAALRLAKEVQA